MKNYNLLVVTPLVLGLSALIVLDRQSYTVTMWAVRSIAAMFILFGLGNLVHQRWP